MSRTKKRAWHGTNLRGSIKGLNFDQAAWRPSPVRHNIWEIVVHCAYWKYIVRRRLLNEKKGSFPLKGSNWFKRPMVANEKAWRADIALLDETHRSMRNAIAGLTSSDLKKNPTGSTWTTRQTISGIASHDLYHAGQIQLLKRRQKEKLSRMKNGLSPRRKDSVLDSSRMMKKSIQLAAHEVREAIPLGDTFPKEPFGSAEDATTLRN